MKRFARSLSVCACTVLCLAPAAGVRAQDYPGKPITIVTDGFAGSIGDVAIRMLAKKMGDAMGQPMIIESHPGAQGALAAGIVKRAEPDGYTIFYAASSGMVIARFMVKNQPYDSISDFAPIASVISTATFLVARSSLGARSLQDLIRIARERPGRLTYGSTGPGSPFHLWAEALKSAAGIDMLHVPYNGGKASVFVNDIIAGRLDVLWLSYTILKTQLKSDKLSVLAANLDKRYALLPDVPTVSEVLPNYKFAPSLYGLLAPRETPATIRNRLAGELREAEKDPQIAEKMSGLGMIPIASTPEELTQRLKTSIQDIGDIARSIGLEPK